MNNLPRFMTYKEALKYFNIGSYNTLYKYIKLGLPVTKVGNSKRIDQVEADKFMDSNTVREA